VAERVTHLPRRCAATLLHLNTRSRTGPRFGASTQAQPGRGRGTHKLLSTPGARRVSKPPRYSASGFALVAWGLPVLSRTWAARGQGNAPRLTTWVTQVLCSAEPLTTTHGGSIVILSRENLRARTHHTHQPSPVIAHAGKAGPTTLIKKARPTPRRPARPREPHALRLAMIVSNERPPLKQPPCGAVRAGVNLTFWFLFWELAAGGGSARNRRKFDGGGSVGSACFRSRAPRSKKPANTS